MTTPASGQDNSRPLTNDEEEGEPPGVVVGTDFARKGGQTSVEAKGNREPFIYRDYSRVPPPPNHSSQIQNRMLEQQQDLAAVRSLKLPAKLDAMLSIPEFQHIISWLPHGRAWKIHNTILFLQYVMPRFFEYNNYNSFVRLVNAWGFRRFTKGPDRNAYWHELFLKSLPHLHAKMHRLTQHQKKLPLDSDEEPDLHRISNLLPLPVYPEEPGSLTTQRNLLGESDLQFRQHQSVPRPGPRPLEPAMRAHQVEAQGGLHNMMRNFEGGVFQHHMTLESNIQESDMLNIQEQLHEQTRLLERQQNQLQQLQQLERLRQEQRQLLNLQALSTLQQQERDHSSMGSDRDEIVSSDLQGYQAQHSIPGTNPPPIGDMMSLVAQIPSARGGPSNIQNEGYQWYQDYQGWDPVILAQLQEREDQRKKSPPEER